MSPNPGPASDWGHGVTNAMSVDVEEYFQVSAFAGTVSETDWEGLPSRVEPEIDRILELMDESGVRATFFCLGWIAERHRTMINRIAAAGHEIASHGYRHSRATEQSPETFRDDISRTKDILENITGVAVKGYRAASFSVDHSNPWVHDILESAGYRYSSSIYPVRHDHYGMPDAPRFCYRPVKGGTLVEFPMSTVRLSGRNFPVSGGGYFRLAPYSLTRRAFRRLNLAEQEPGIFYFHPWEIDPGQPRLEIRSRKARFRHYVNLGRMEKKLTRLFRDFSWDRVDNVLISKGYEA